MPSKDKDKSVIVTHRAILKESADKPTEKAVDDFQHTTAPTLKPLAKTADRPAEKPAAKPAEAPVRESPDKPAEKPAPTAANAKNQQNQQEQLDKQAAAIQRLIDSRKYELPINAVEKRKAKHFVVLGLILAVLLVLAWVDIAADAGLIHLPGVKPLTHFFTN